MEVLLYFVIPLLWGISSLAFCLLLLILIAKKIMKKDVKKTKRRLIVALICSIVTLAIIGTYDIESEDDSAAGDAVASENAETTNDHSEETEPVTEVVTEHETPIGSSKDRPFIVTANELADEINADIDAAKEKYNGKWVKITGEITDTSDGGVCYGYYIYGKSVITGYRGLRIMCWCDDGPYSGSVIGDTQTFVGQVLEITTVNVTEIINCERVEP